MKAFYCTLFLPFVCSVIVVKSSVAADIKLDSDSMIEGLYEGERYRLYVPYEEIPQGAEPAKYDNFCHNLEAVDGMKWQLLDLKRRGIMYKHFSRHAKEPPSKKFNFDVSNLIIKKHVAGHKGGYVLYSFGQRRPRHIREDSKLDSRTTRPLCELTDMESKAPKQRSLNDYELHGLNIGDKVNVKLFRKQENFNEKFNNGTPKINLRNNEGDAIIPEFDVEFNYKAIFPSRCYYALEKENQKNEYDISRARLEKIGEEVDELLLKNNKYKLMYN